MFPRRPIQWGKDFSLDMPRCLAGDLISIQNFAGKNVEWPKKVKIGKNGKITTDFEQQFWVKPQGTDSQLEPNEPWQPWFMILWSLLASFTAAGMNPHQDSPCGSGSWSTGCPGFCRISTAFWHPTFMLRPAIFAGKHGWRMQLMQQLTSKKITKGWAQHMSKCWFRIPHNYPEISKTKHIWYTYVFKII